MVSKGIIAAIIAVSIVGILVIGGLAFYYMVRSSNDQKAQSLSCLEKQFGPIKNKP